MQLSIPSSTEPIVSAQGIAGISWFTFFQNLWRIVGGNYGITLGGNLSLSTTPASNTGATETDLITYSLPKDTMVNDGDLLEIQAWGSYAANGNNKTVKLVFGGQTILDTGAVAANSGAWSIKASIIRKSSTTQEIISEIISGNSSVPTSSTRTGGAQNLATALTIKCTGQGSSDNDITQYALVVKLTPNI